MAVGKVAYYWNGLHESLGHLFVKVAGVEQRIGMAIWHSLQSDRAQRDMLRAALLADIRGRWDDRPEAVQAIRWLLSQTQILADRRNDALHAPLDVELSWDQGRARYAVVPDHLGGNPRAKKLLNKDLQEELEWYAETAATLKAFAVHATYAIDLPSEPWPETPRLPSLAQSQPRRP